jgi:uncharacterized membrane protein
MVIKERLKAKMIELNKIYDTNVFAMTCLYITLYSLVFVATIVAMCVVISIVCGILVVALAVVFCVFALLTPLMAIHHLLNLKRNKNG